MDQKEARKYVTANPPPDYNAERRPSLLGRLFRRMSSSEENSPPGMNMQGAGMGQSFESGERRQSITEAVQQNYVISKPPQPKKVNPDPEFNLFT